MSNIIGGECWVMDTGGWVQLVGGPTGPQIMEFEYSYFGEVYAQTSLIVGGGHSPVWTRVLRVRYARDVPPDIIPRSIVLTTRHGGIIHAAWSNDTTGYTIGFRLACVEDPSYDSIPTTLPGGTSTEDTTVGTTAGALGYHFWAVLQYLPDGDVVVSGQVAAPIT